MTTVYLAGGFHSGWQDTIIATVPEFAYCDPRTHGLKDEAQYTFWDLGGIRESDLVFAYLEADNPSGYGLVFELGYAKALGRQIIFVDEMSALDRDTKRYLGMVRASADVVFESFGASLAFMKCLARI